MARRGAPGHGVCPAQPVPGYRGRRRRGRRRRPAGGRRFCGHRHPARRAAAPAALLRRAAARRGGRRQRPATPSYPSTPSSQSWTVCCARWLHVCACNKLHHACVPSSPRPPPCQVRNYVLELSMDRRVEQQLGAAPCDACGADTYEANLACHVCGHRCGGRSLLRFSFGRDGEAGGGQSAGAWLRAPLRSQRCAH